MRRDRDLKHEHLLGELLQLAAQLDIEVRREYLGDAEAPAESGLVRLKGKHILFLDRRLTPLEAVEVVVSVLAPFSLDHVYVKPAVRSLLGAQGRDWED